MISESLETLARHPITPSFAPLDSQNLKLIFKLFAENASRFLINISTLIAHRSRGDYRNFRSNWEESSGWIGSLAPTRTESSSGWR